MTGGAGLPLGRVNAARTSNYGTLYVRRGDIVLQNVVEGDLTICVAKWLIWHIEPMPSMQMEGREWLTQALFCIRLDAPGAPQVLTWTPERTVLRWGVIPLDSPDEEVVYPTPNKP